MIKKILKVKGREARLLRFVNVSCSGLAFLLIFVFVFSVVFLRTNIGLASDLALTISPPLIKNNLNPGESWAGVIKVINNNKESIKVYAEVVNFSSDENGNISFEDLGVKKEDLEIGNGSSLREWIDIDLGAIDLKSFESKEIPFAIKVPENASPGGHYAAVMIGTNPPDLEGGTGIKISSRISSLLMINIAGDIVEKGKIREFSVAKTFYSVPKIDFLMKFKNSGNVHLQPRGEIRIFNMFDKEVGRLPINHETNFGNVLPQTTREWGLSWQGLEGIAKMGRYKASLIVNYGNSAKMNDSWDLYFWYLDFKIITWFISGVAIFILLLFLFIKLSIRRAVRSAQKELGLKQGPRKLKRVLVKRPVIQKKARSENGSVVDLKKK